MTRLAIWTPGGVGGGHFNQGYPKLMDILRSLSKSHEVVVFTAVGTTLSGQQDLEIVSSPKRIHSSWRRWLFLARRFARMHRQHPFDILISCWAYPSGLIGVLLGQLYRKPSIVIVLGGDVAYVPVVGYGLLTRPLHCRLVLWTCRHATELIAVSSYQAGILKRFGLDREPLIIPWGVDGAKFQSSPRFLESTVRFVHVGNLTEVKNQDMLLRAFALISKKIDARLRIVGPDYLEGALQKLVDDLGLQRNVTFVGPVPYSEIIHEYASGDVYLLTSYSEGQNLTLTEAAMSGLLLVSTPVGAACDIGREGVVLVPQNDPTRMADMVIEVVGDHLERNAFIDHSLSWARAHDFSWTMERLGEIISNLVQ